MWPSTCTNLPLYFYLPPLQLHLMTPEVIADMNINPDALTDFILWSDIDTFQSQTDFIIRSAPKVEHDRLRSRFDNMKQLLPSWAGHHNASLPVGRLPNELLTSIFRELVHMYDPEVSDDEAASSPSGWIVITFVCRRWRDVALGSSILWTRIDSTDIKWLHGYRLARQRAFVSRSKSCPINVDFGGLSQWDPLTSGVILDACRRWQRVKGIRLDYRFLDTLQLASTVPFDLPLLRRVDVYFASTLELRESLGTLMSLGLPALTDLTTNCSPWPIVKSWIKPTLVSLTVNGTSDESEGPAATEWIDVLRSLRSLKVLSLTYALGTTELSREDCHHTPGRPVCLPFLETVELYVDRPDLLDGCAYLMHHIDSPWHTDVRIVLWLDDDDELLTALPDYKWFFSSLASRTTNALRRVTEQNPDKHDIEAWFEWNEDRLAMGATAPAVQKDLLYVEIPAPQRDLLRPAVEELVQHVCAASSALLANVGLDRRTWGALAAQPVAALAMWTQALPVFLDVLEAALRDGRADAFLPGLQTLTIDHFPPSARLPRPRPGQKVGHGPRPLLQRLADALYERHKEGLGPAVVDLHGGAKPVAIDYTAEPSLPEEALCDEDDETSPVSTLLYPVR